MTNDQKLATLMIQDAHRTMGKLLERTYGKPDEQDWDSLIALARAMEDGNIINRPRIPALKWSDEPATVAAQ